MCGYYLMDAFFDGDESSDHFTDIAPQSPKLPYRPLLWDLRGFLDTTEGQAALFLLRGTSSITRCQNKMLMDCHLGTQRSIRVRSSGLKTADMKRARITADNVSHMVEPNTVQNVTVAGTRNNSWTMQVGPRLIRTFEFVSSNHIMSIMPWHSMKTDREISGSARMIKDCIGYRSNRSAPTPKSRA